MTSSVRSIMLWPPTRSIILPEHPMYKYSSPRDHVYTPSPCMALNSSPVNFMIAGIRASSAYVLYTIITIAHRIVNGLLGYMTTVRTIWHSEQPNWWYGHPNRKASGPYPVDAE